MIEVAKQVIDQQIDAIKAMRDRINGDLSQAIKVIKGCTGRVVITGMGKSGLVGAKIAATMASTGTPAFFLHPGEGLHGDLGMLVPGDVVIAISNSGESEEILGTLPVIKKLGLPLIAMCGRANSNLVKRADVFLDISVEREACCLGLAPTSSTTVTLVLGDALSQQLLSDKNFGRDDFALRHPAGALGKKLLMRVEDVMLSKREDIPLVPMETEVKQALFEITDKKLGSTGVIDAEGSLVGIFTDGDLRRALEEKGYSLFESPISEVMNPNPKKIAKHILASTALQKMEQQGVTSLFVFEQEEATVPIGVIHMHDLVKAGVTCD